MSKNVSVQELEEFHAMVDSIMEDLENGKIKGNPLEPISKTVEEIDQEDLVQTGSAVEMGEDEIMAAQAQADAQAEANDHKEATPGVIPINGKNFQFTEEGEFIGKPGKVLVVVSNESGEVVFGSAAVAADETGFNPTTMRDRCKKEYVDVEGNTWKYRERYD